MRINLLELFRYNIKIVISKKCLIFVLAALLVPKALNLSNAMYFEMIIPLCGTFIFSNILFFEDDFNVSQFYYSTAIKKATILLIRIFINVMMFLVLSLFFYVYIRFIVPNKIIDEYALSDNISIYQMIFVIGSINFLFFGCLSVTISNLFKNAIIGIVVSIAYGLFWMQQYINLKHLIINPFSYSAGLENYTTYKFFTIASIIFILILNCYYVNNKFYKSRL